MLLLVVGMAGTFGQDMCGSSAINRQNEGTKVGEHETAGTEVQWTGRRKRIIVDGERLSTSDTMEKVVGQQNGHSARAAQHVQP
eukprot:COSAG01_NODE_7987_length_2963_cov_2.214036_2_plen_84_part_00